MGFYQTIKSFVKRKIIRSSRDRWNYQYQNRRWDNLHKEDGRINAVIDLLSVSGKQLDILEIGCGEAVLFRNLPEGLYKSFIGVDISDVAVEAAKAFEKEDVKFITGDMNAYRPTGKFDFIIFNESLYYSGDPLQVLKRFEPTLLPGGGIIVTAVRNKYTSPMWPKILGAYKTVEEESVTNADLVWDIKRLVPAKG